MPVKITILYDNTSASGHLHADWGFACFVELPGRTVLFDTGGKGSILLENMRKLNIAPTAVDEVFITHFHFDHIGGLGAFLEENHHVTVYAPASLRGIRHARKVVYVEGARELFDNVYSTGELEHIEQSLAIKTENGLVLIVGCSHPDMKNIFEAVSPFGKIYAIIGGLHGFMDFDLFKNLGLICPTHCTQHKEELQRLYPEKYVEGGVGRIIEI